MKKEYVKPEAEMMKFLEEEELMSDLGSISGLDHELGTGNALNEWRG